MPWQLTTITRSFLAFLFRPDGGRRGDDVASGVMIGVGEVSSSVWEFDCRLEKLFVVAISRVDANRLLEKLGISHWQQIQEISAFAKASYTQLFMLSVCTIPHNYHIE